MASVVDSRTTGAAAAGTSQGSSIAAGMLDVPAVIEKLRAEQPEYIAIGNSMMFSRFDMTPEKLNALTGHKFFFILRGGSTTAAWYLTLKNVVAASGVHPKLVFFFFRNTELTSPLVNTAGQNAPYLNSLRGPKEPLVDLLLQPPPARDGLFDGLVDRVGLWLDGPHGVYHYAGAKDAVQQRLSNLAMKAGGLKGRRLAVQDRFSLTHLRYDVPADISANDEAKDGTFDPYQSLSKDYVNPEEHSFLPPIMDVARENGYKLLFFRVKRRPDSPDGIAVSEPADMRGYVERLQHWIEVRGGLFYDETYDPNIRLEIYNDGDHVGEEHRDWYRRYFWQRMAPVFTGAPAGG